MKTKEAIISNPTAILAKQKGFNWQDDYTVFTSIETEKYPEGEIFLKPTQSILQRWIREQFNIHVEPVLKFNNTRQVYKFTIKQVANVGLYFVRNVNDKREFESFEDALEIGLLTALELIEIK